MQGPESKVDGTMCLSAKFPSSISGHPRIYEALYFRSGTAHPCDLQVLAPSILSASVPAAHVLTSDL